MHEELVCAHGPCTCRVEKPGQYCSKACKEGGAGTTCNCGHPGCGGAGQKSRTR
jgi:hypothetical protein